MRRSSSALIVVLALAAAPAVATTFLPMADADLADQAPVIAQVRIEAIEPAPIAGPPSTDVFLQVERVVKGHVAGSTVILRVPGGIGPDGIGLRIQGAPTFQLGERVLLFLVPRRDGTYGLLHLMLGVFREAQAGRQRVAVRDVAEAVDLLGAADAGKLPGDAPALARDFDRFVEWLAERARGVDGGAGYWVADGEGLAPPAAPSLLDDRCTQLNFRWFAFDDGGSIAWVVDRRGFDGAGGGQRAFAPARRAWTRDSGTPLRLEETSGRAGRGLGAADGVNSVLFNDPGDEIGGSFGCETGGVVAVSGIWFDNGRDASCRLLGPGEKGSFGGRTFLRILEADIVTNDGSGCFFARRRRGLSEVLAHELGHAMGLSHLASPQALMGGLVRGDGPGTGLADEDREAIRVLYGDSPRPPGR